MTRERVLQGVVDFWEKHGYSPSLADISKEVGIVKSVVSYHLDNLQKIGILTRDKKVSRSIVLAKPQEVPERGVIWCQVENSDEVAGVLHTIRNSAPIGWQSVLWVVLSSGEKLDVLGEEEMARHGWYRRDDED